MSIVFEEGEFVKGTGLDGEMTLSLRGWQAIG